MAARHSGAKGAPAALADVTAYRKVVAAGSNEAERGSALLADHKGAIGL